MERKETIENKLYTSSEILDIVNERFDLKIMKNNSTYQWLYRHNFSRQPDKAKNGAYLYDKETAEEIISYFGRKVEIKKLKEKIRKDTLEDRQKLKELRAANNEFAAKYKRW